MKQVKLKKRCSEQVYFHRVVGADKLVSSSHYTTLTPDGFNELLDKRPRSEATPRWQVRVGTVYVNCSKMRDERLTDVSPTPPAYLAC